MTDNIKRTLREWPESEKPREKLLSHGATKLTDVELLAILLRTGTRTKSHSKTAVDIAREVMMTFDDSLEVLSARDALELSAIAGIGKVKAVTLSAAFELGRRMQSNPSRDMPLLNNPDAVYKFIMREFAGEKREIFKVIALSTSGQARQNGDGRNAERKSRRCKGRVQVCDTRRSGEHHRGTQSPEREARSEQGGHTDHQRPRYLRKIPGHLRARPSDCRADRIFEHEEWGIYLNELIRSVFRKGHSRKPVRSMSSS